MAAVNAPLTELVNLIGLPATLRLVEKFGGTTIYVPHQSRVKLHSAVAQVVGTDAVRQLATVWPQAHVVVPRGAAYVRHQRDMAVLADAEKFSVARLARKYETTERNIYRILERGAQQPPLGLSGPSDAQGDLFS